MHNLTTWKRTQACIHFMSSNAEIVSKQVQRMRAGLQKSNIYKIKSHKNSTQYLPFQSRITCGVSVVDKAMQLLPTWCCVIACKACSSGKNAKINACRCPSTSHSRLVREQQCQLVWLLAVVSNSSGMKTESSTTIMPWAAQREKAQCGCNQVLPLRRKQQGKPQHCSLSDNDCMP